MVFVLYASQAVEIGGNTRFHTSSSNTIQVVIQRTPLYSEALAMLEGNLGLFSFINHVFIHMLVLHEPMPSRTHLLK